MREPDPFEVLRATAHPDTRVVRLDDRTVVRTSGQPASRVGNAVHHTGGPPTGADEVAAALADAHRRLADPAATPRVVLRRPADGAALASAVGSRTPLDVLVLRARAQVATTARRADVAVGPPRDERGWHAATVLRRHAAGGDGDAAARGRGGRDELLRWWVEGRRRLVGTGRARVALAERFGTPVATATLVWDPAAAVGVDAAGLAVLTDLVVHPAHRGLGIATTTAAWLLDTHLAAFPRALVATVVPAPLTPTLEGHGWVVHGKLVEIADEGGG